MTCSYQPSQMRFRGEKVELGSQRSPVWTTIRLIVQKGDILPS